MQRLRSAKSSRISLSVSTLAERLPVVALIVFLVAAGAMFVFPSPASAVARPPTDWSFYVLSMNTSTAYNLGCNQGKFDTSHGRVNSFVVLDFGAENSANTGTILISGINVSWAQDRSYAQEFVHGYWICTGANATSRLHLGMGTNNSAGAVNSTSGLNWSKTVNGVRTYINAHFGGGQTVMHGANDIEQWEGTAPYSAVAAWISGWSALSTNPGTYLNYGSADGCAPYGSCNGGWTQANYYYVSWGAPPALVAPEIYYSPNNAMQWRSISDSGSEPIGFTAPWDQHDLDTSTNSSAQAWADMQAQGTSCCPYSMQIHTA